MSPTDDFNLIRKRASKGKVVRFADHEGHELCEVFHFEGHGFNKEINAKTNSRPLTLVNLPWTQDALMKKLQRGKVALENVVKTERGMIGVAAVKNIAYNKEVLVHYSFDGWTTVKETIAAFYKQDSSHQNDYFVFVLTNKDYYSGKGWKLEFAICYRVAGLEYWDNNNGKNYSLQS